MEFSYIHEKLLYLPATNKLWGIAISPNDIIRYRHIPSVTPKFTHFWCWWATPKNNINIKRHKHDFTTISILEHKKINNGYSPITDEKLLEMWPNFHQQLHQRIIFEVFKND